MTKRVSPPLPALLPYTLPDRHAERHHWRGIHDPVRGERVRRILALRKQLKDTEHAAQRAKRAARTLTRAAASDEAYADAATEARDRVLRLAAYVHAMERALARLVVAHARTQHARAQLAASDEA